MASTWKHDNYTKLISRSEEENDFKAAGKLRNGEANFRQLKFKHSFVGCSQRTLLVDWNSELVTFPSGKQGNEGNLFGEVQVSLAEGSISSE